MSKGPLGRPPGVCSCLTKSSNSTLKESNQYQSLNAPIAAFTMAVILCSYSLYSINSARRGAQTTSPSQNESRKKRDSSWVQKALEDEKANRA